MAPSKVNGITSLISLIIIYKLVQQYHIKRSASSATPSASPSQSDTKAASSKSQSNNAAATNKTQTADVSSAEHHTPKPHVRPLVICGPSGVGKGTLLTKLLADYPAVFARSVSHTTRQPRPGEVNGKSYHFIDKPTMQQQVNDGLFIESAEIHGNLYGQSISAVEDVCATGRVCILEIDVQGAVSVAKTTLQPHYLFIQPPSMTALRERLQRRGSENQDSMTKRLATADNEMAFLEQNKRMFDAVVTNNDLQVCYKELISTLSKWYPAMQKYNVVKSPVKST